MQKTTNEKCNEEQELSLEVISENLAEKLMNTYKAKKTSSSKSNTCTPALNPTTTSYSNDQFESQNQAVEISLSEAKNNIKQNEARQEKDVKAYKARLIREYNSPSQEDQKASSEVQFRTQVDLSIIPQNGPPIKAEIDLNKKSKCGDTVKNHLESLNDLIDLNIEDLNSLQFVDKISQIIIPNYYEEKSYLSRDYPTQLLSILNSKTITTFEQLMTEWAECGESIEIDLSETQTKKANDDLFIDQINSFKSNLPLKRNVEIWLNHFNELKKTETSNYLQKTELESPKTELKLKVEKFKLALNLLEDLLTEENPAYLVNEPLNGENPLFLNVEDLIDAWKSRMGDEREIFSKEEIEHISLTICNISDVNPETIKRYIKSCRNHLDGDQVNLN